MQKILSILFSAGISATFAQLQLPIQYDTTIIEHEINFSGDSEYHSTSLRRDFANSLTYGRNISNESKDKTFQAHNASNNINRVGKDIQSEIEYRNYKVNLFGNENWGYLVKGGYYFIGAGAYANDLFGLAFYGNESYLGRGADFSGTMTNISAFQKIGFGAINKKTKSAITLNVVNVSNLITGKIREGELTQNDDGSEINFDARGSFAFTDKKTFSNGTGLSIDFDFKIPILWIKQQKAYIQVQAKNLGFAYMHQGVKEYSIDSSYHYSGFSFDQLIGNKTIVSDDFSVLDTLGVQTSRKKSMAILPCMFQVGKIINEHYAGKWQSFFGLRIYPTLPYNPLFYAGGNWRPKAWLDLGLSASYGGFGRFRGGFYASVKAKSFNIGVGTEDLYGVISKNAFGQSFNLRLRCKF